MGVPINNEYKGIPVVAIAFFDQHQKKWALFKRSAQDSYEGYWEFPGGKVDAGEDLIQALFREISEELHYHIDVSKLDYVGDVSYNYPNKLIHLHLYVYPLSEVRFNLVDHDDQVWVEFNQLKTYHLAPADVPFIEKLRIWLHR